MCSFTRIYIHVCVCVCFCVPRASRSCLYPYGIVLQCVAVFCSVSQCVAVCSFICTYISVCVCVCVCICASCFPILPLPTRYYCVAVCCSALQCVALCCSALQCAGGERPIKLERAPHVSTTHHAHKPQTNIENQKRTKDRNSHSRNMSQMWTFHDTHTRQELFPRFEHTCGGKKC